MDPQKAHKTEIYRLGSRRKASKVVAHVRPFFQGLATFSPLPEKVVSMMEKMADKIEDEAKKEQLGPRI